MHRAVGARAARWRWRCAVASPAPRPRSSPRRRHAAAATRSTAAARAFARAEYQRAIEILRPLLYPEVRLESEGEIVQAHRMLGVAYLFEEQAATRRKREFRKLLELRPDYRFDPLLDPPRVVDFFNGVLKEEEATISGAGGQAQEARGRAGGAARSARPSALRAGATVVRYERNSLRRELHPVRRRAVPERPAAQGLDVPRRRVGAGGDLAGRRSRPTSRCTGSRRGALQRCSRSTPAAAAVLPGRQRSTARRRTRRQLLLRVQVGQRAAVLRGGDLGRHRRHPQLPAGGPLDGDGRRRPARRRRPPRPPLDQLRIRPCHPPASAAAWTF